MGWDGIDFNEISLTTPEIFDYVASILCVSVQTEALQ